MAYDVAKLAKVVATLPGTLEADTVYFVRVGSGFDLYVTNHTGTVVAYALNGGAAASGASGQSEVDFGSGGNTNASTTITGQASIAAESSVVATLLPKATTEHAIDDHVVEEIDVFAGNIVAGTGFTIYAKTRNVPLYGKYAVAWQWK